MFWPGWAPVSPSLSPLCSSQSSLWATRVYSALLTCDWSISAILLSHWSISSAVLLSHLSISAVLFSDWWTLTWLPPLPPLLRASLEIWAPKNNLCFFPVRCLSLYQIHNCSHSNLKIIRWCNSGDFCSACCLCQSWCSHGIWTKCIERLEHFKTIQITSDTAVS